MEKRNLLIIMFFLSVSTLFAQQVVIEKITPTAFFINGNNNALEQVVWLEVTNKEKYAASVNLTANLGNKKVYHKTITLEPGKNDIEFTLPDITSVTPVEIEISNKKNKQLTEKSLNWAPQKKWTIHCVTYSHHDLGYGDIPHRLRRDNRMENMELMLKLCNQTDTWHDDAKYRAVLETSEPITSYLSFCNKEKAEELKRRIKEGRIQISAIHTTVNTEMLGHEMMARLFYLSNRHAVDMLGIPPASTTNFDDVIGITLPFFTYAKEAGMKNMFFGPNNPKMLFHQPAQKEPLYYMTGADEDMQNKVLVRCRYYSGDAIRSNKYIKPLGEEVVQRIVDNYEAEKWPYDCILSQDGWDFTLLTIDNAKHIKELNEKYAYPRMICSTMDMFFNDVRAQLDKYPIKTFTKDGNNQWADQPASDSKLLGEARKLDEFIPVAEKWATIVFNQFGMAYPWEDIYQAYHRVLLYHEHTCGSSAFKPAYQYATEQQELRDMVGDAKKYTNKVLNSSLDKITASITCKSDNQIAVFNSLSFPKTDLVYFDMPTGWQNANVKDNVTNKIIQSQKIGNRWAFIANNVPSLGYKTFTLQKTKKEKEIAKSNEITFENNFYRVSLDSVTGAIASLYDIELLRELIDQESPYRLNEYIYERYNTPGKELKSNFYGAELIDFEISDGPMAQVLTLHQKAEGSKSIVQTLTFHKLKKQIDVSMTIDKSCSGRSQSINDTGTLTNKEAIYVALPFAVDNYRFKHSLPGMSIEPVKEMFDSVATAHYGIRHFASVYNDNFGISVAPIEAGLIEYGHPRSDAMPGFWGTEDQFERKPVYPENSSMFLYLLNNMFDVNIILTQPGIKTFAYSITSYKRDEKSAEQFGWDVHTPLQSRYIAEKQKGTLPADIHSFATVSHANIVCTTIKPAEENGDGYIIRFTETEGHPTQCKVSLSMFDKVQSVEVTNLVEDNKGIKLPVDADGSFTLSMDKFGVKTLRILPVAKEKPSIPTFTANAVSDMRIKLNINAAANATVYKIYRSTKADFEASPLTYVAQTADSIFIDKPTLNFGNWINNVLNPATTYYYKIVAYNNDNYRSAPSSAVKIATRKSSEANDVPAQVFDLKAVNVSDVSFDNYINVHWRANVESDITKYIVYRSNKPDFTADESSKIVEIDITQKGNGSAHPLKEYDYCMYPDKTVKPGRIYYYKVMAMDKAGQSSPSSTVARAKTKLK